MDNGIEVRIQDDYGCITAYCGGASEKSALAFIANAELSFKQVKREGNKWTVVQPRVTHYLTDPFGGSLPLCGARRYNRLSTGIDDVNCLKCRGLLDANLI